jgi:hypothetical protein
MVFFDLFICVSSRARYFGTRMTQVGTYNGIFVSYSTANTVWKRLGTQAEFPLVIVHQMRWYAQGDVLLVATMGRGIYSMLNATTIISCASAHACPANKTLAAPAVASRAAPYVYADIACPAVPVAPVPAWVPPPDPEPEPEDDSELSDATARSPLDVGASVTSLCVSVFLFLTAMY